MSGAEGIEFDPELIRRLVAGHDRNALFARDGLLDQLRTAVHRHLEQVAHQPDVGYIALERVEASHREDGARAQITRHQMKHPQFAARVVALNAIGHSIAEIQRGTSLLIGEYLSPEVIDIVLADARRAAANWNSRALDTSYPIVTFETVRVKWRDGSAGRSRLSHFALGFQAHGPKEVLSVWFETGAEAQFWTDALRSLQERGLRDVLFVLGSNPHLHSLLREVFPEARPVAHVGELMRRSLSIATSKDRSAVSLALRRVHSARDAKEALDQLGEFEKGGLGLKYPAISLVWRRSWDGLAEFFQIPREVRRVMSSTHATDGLRRAYKRALQGHGHLSSIEDATALMHLAMQDVQLRWKRPQREWHAAKLKLAALFPDHFSAA